MLLRAKAGSIEPPTTMIRMLACCIRYGTCVNNSGNWCINLFAYMIWRMSLSKYSLKYRLWHITCESLFQWSLCSVSLTKFELLAPAIFMSRFAQILYDVHDKQKYVSTQDCRPSVCVYRTRQRIVVLVFFSMENIGSCAGYWEIPSRYLKIHLYQVPETNSLCQWPLHYRGNLIGRPRNWLVSEKHLTARRWYSICPHICWC